MHGTTALALGFIVTCSGEDGRREHSALSASEAQTTETYLCEQVRRLEESVERALEELDKRVSGVESRSDAARKDVIAFHQAIINELMCIVAVLLGLLALTYPLARYLASRAAGQFERRTAQITEAAYESAKAFWQMSYASVDAAEVLGLDPPIRLALQRAVLSGARVMILVGPSADVIAGADVLSQLGTPSIDCRLLREALRRRCLSPGAIETVQRALDDLTGTHARASDTESQAERAEGNGLDTG